MPNKIQFDRELRQKAEASCDALFGFGYDTKGKGRMSFHTVLSLERSRELFCFLILITAKNAEPEDAFRKVFENSD